MAKKILIGPSLFAEFNSVPIDRLVQNGFEIIKNPYGRKLTTKELLKLLPGVHGLIAGLENLNREVLKRSELKVISRCGSGLSNIDLKAAKELGIKVYSTPDAPTTAVAELTVGALISLLRLLPQMDRLMHQGKWDKRIGVQLAGKQVAIIGFGRIGRKVSQLLRIFEASVVAVDPALSDVVDNTPIVSLEEALRKADIIILHCSGEDLILGEQEFRLMKKGVYLLNAARGGLIDEDALINALDRKIIAGAWLDTFSQEPYSGPLCNYEQIILTPHIGSYTYECRSAMELEAVENLLAGFRECNYA